MLLTSSIGSSRSGSALTLLVLTVITGLVGLTGCGSSKEPTPSGASAPAATEAAPATDKAEPISLTLGGYTTPREAYGVILPAFSAQWSKSSGRAVTFKESYLGSGAQARAIADGFEADVAALSLEPDIETIKKAGLITHDWKAGEFGGIVSRSIVVIGVRAGNPKNIHDWDDLAKPGIEVLTPNVRTSGGARWNVAAIVGAALRGHTKAKANDPAAAQKLLAAVLHNVKIMDKGGRESLLSFERGVGDAIITYENELLVGKQKGQAYEQIVPSSTILIENPVALVDSYVDKHATREAAKALVDFLFTADAQRIYAKHGLRPVLPEVEKEVAANYPAPKDLFTIRDLGDWAGANKDIFDKDASYDKALAAASGGGAP